VALCREASDRRWEWPDGTLDTVKPRTIENWYYAYRAGGFSALMPMDRKDLGVTDIPPALADLVVRAKRERPRRSIKRIIKLLVRARRAAPGELSKSAVQRLLACQGISGRPVNGPTAERRSFIYEYPATSWSGRAPPAPARDLARRTPAQGYMLSQIDCATRFVPRATSPLGGRRRPGARPQAGPARHGLWRSYYVDLGAAYIARSLKLICAELGMHLSHAGPRDAAPRASSRNGTAPGVTRSRASCPTTPSHSPSSSRSTAPGSPASTTHGFTTRPSAPKEHWLELCDHLRPLPRASRSTRSSSIAPRAHQQDRHRPLGRRPVSK